MRQGNIITQVDNNGVKKKTNEYTVKELEEFERQFREEQCVIERDYDDYSDYDDGYGTFPPGIPFNAI